MGSVLRTKTFTARFRVGFVWHLFSPLKKHLRIGYVLTGIFLITALVGAFIALLRRKAEFVVKRHGQRFYLRFGLVEWVLVTPINGPNCLEFRV